MLARREFVERTLCALLGAPTVLGASALLTGCASLVTRTVAPIDGALRLPLVHYPELAAPGGSLKVVAEGTTDAIFVLSLGAARYAALSPICTHLGCTVEIEGARLVCPCHGSTYDRGGNVLQGPAERPLASYATQLSSDGVLIIDLGSRT